MKLRLLPLAFSLAAAFSASAQAQSLAQLYEAAKGYDASYKAAQSQYQANLAKAEQAKALLRPTAGLGSTLSETDFNSQRTAYQTLVLVPGVPLLLLANPFTALPTKPHINKG